MLLQHKCSNIQTMKVSNNYNKKVKLQKRRSGLAAVAVILLRGPEVKLLVNGDYMVLKYSIIPGDATS